MKKILSIMVVALFLFSITAFAKDGADDSSSSTSSSSSASSDDIVNGVKVRGDGSIDDSQSTSNDSSDDIVNGVKLRGDGSIDDDQSINGSDSRDDFVNGTKLRGDGSIDDNQNEAGDDSRNRGNDSARDRNESEKTEIHSSVSGLENAILRVQKNETRDHLEEVLAKIQEKRKEQLSKLENMTVEKDERTNTTVIRGEGRAKFLGFIPTAKTYEYEVDQNGNVIKHKKFFDFMFKKQDPVV